MVLSYATKRMRPGGRIEAHTVAVFGVRFGPPSIPFHQILSAYLVRHTHSVARLETNHAIGRDIDQWCIDVYDALHPKEK
jgi:hypothetical protein